MSSAARYGRIWRFSTGGCFAWVLRIVGEWGEFHNGNKYLPSSCKKFSHLMHKGFLIITMSLSSIEEVHPFFKRGKKAFSGHGNRMFDTSPVKSNDNLHL
jgi:hypothetical protein